jgi:transposase
MRKSFDGLSALAVDVIKQDPLAGHLFVFRNKNGGRLKVLYWDRDGLCLWYKRLEKGSFELPMSNDDSVEISSSQLAMLLDGVAMSAPRRRRFVLGVR